MQAENGKHRQDIVALLMASFESKGISMFGPRSEEKFYQNSNHNGISKKDCIKIIKDDLAISGDELSSLADIHPAWIVRELEKESPKVIGIILRWLPSRHVRYILEHLPKRLKMSLPKLVDSFAVPTEILKLIRSGFERKFTVPKAKENGKIDSFNDMALLSSSDLETLFKDLGIHELAMAFQNIDQSGVRVLLNRMSIQSARALQQRIKDVSGTSQALLKDARYTILEVAMDQEDIEKLLLETGLSAFSKAVKGEQLFESMKMKLDPVVSYLFKRYVDQHSGVNHLCQKRQDLIMERYALLSKAGQIENKFIG